MSEIRFDASGHEAALEILAGAFGPLARVGCGNFSEVFAATTVAAPASFADLAERLNGLPAALGARVSVHPDAVAAVARGCPELARAYQDRVFDPRALVARVQSRAYADPGVACGGGAERLHWELCRLERGGARGWDIVPLFLGAFRVGRTSVTLMEYVRGATVAQVLSGADFESDTRVRGAIADSIERTGRALRALGMLHGDLTPSNIMVRLDPVALPESPDPSGQRAWARFVPGGYAVLVDLEHASRFAHGSPASQHFQPIVHGLRGSDAHPPPSAPLPFTSCPQGRGPPARKPETDRGQQGGVGGRRFATIAPVPAPPPATVAARCKEKQRVEKEKAVRSASASSSSCPLSSRPRMAGRRVRMT
jgi:hypothetical protein